ncbi:MAG TPA: IS4 family transposase [Steroidobacteraceae bacterium]|nr:IS4 family transposase [Steroidobacteraceae bacterium]
MFSVNRFSELLKLLPRGVFDRSVEQHQADRYRKHCSTWQQMVAMLYGQLSGASSLRVLERGFNAHTSHHYHLGCRSVRRSSLAEMNARTPERVFEEVAHTLMQQMHGRLRREGEEFLRLLDSTSLTLKGEGFDAWTSHNRTRNTQGLKVHVLLAGTHSIPLAQQISAPNVNDVEYARGLSIEPAVTYVFDKAYCDYSWWWRLQCSNARFVTRFKCNAKLASLKQRAIPKAAQHIVLSDELVRFANKHPGAGRKNPYVLPIRRIKVAREGKPPLVLATNDLKSSAMKIAEAYRSRWQIELFFKWMKQHLRIKSFLGRSERAVRTQVLTALITYLLVALYAKIHQTKQSLWLLLSELRSALFQRSDTEHLRHRRWRERKAEFHDRQTTLFT